jgi:phage virion morphogenesis protein
MSFATSCSVDDAAFRPVLVRMLAVGGNLKPALKAAGEVMVNAAVLRINEEQRGPDGTAWQELSPTYLAHRKRQDSPILVQEGHLRDSITAMATSDQVQVGSNLPYAAIHQFGGTSDMGPKQAAIPARPFIGPSLDEWSDIADAFASYLGGHAL